MALACQATSKPVGQVSLLFAEFPISNPKIRETKVLSHHFLSENEIYRTELKFSALIYTCSGVSSNIFPPIVKETLGIDAKLLQSTVDSPIGLGSRSQSYKVDR